MVFLISLKYVKKETNLFLGYFVHLSTVAEVREQVVHYLPVMARPLVLHQTHHPTIWTPLYADVIVMLSSLILILSQRKNCTIIFF